MKLLTKEICHIQIIGFNHLLFQCNKFGVKYTVYFTLRSVGIIMLNVSCELQ